jgi:SM-20-related protein
MSEKFDELIDSYMDHHVGISEAFITAELSGKLRRNLQKLYDDGEMVPAGIGNALVKDNNQKLRGDSISWIDRDKGNKTEGEFLDRIEAFIDHLNRTCYTGINAYEFHYAMYETGSFYKRHKDQFRNDQGRKYSLISYLNDDWKDAEGGQLRIFRDNKVESIFPANRKAVFFKSDELEHEVAIATRPRMSITGWLKRI